MRILTIGAGMVAAAAIGLAQTAHAGSLGLEVIGDPEPGNSWSANFTVGTTGGVQIQSMLWRINSPGGSFEDPAATFFNSNSGAHTTWDTLPLTSPFADTHFAATGDAVTGLFALQWSVHFAGDTTDWTPADPLEMDIAFFDETDALNLTVRLTFNGTTFSIEQFGDWLAGDGALADGYWDPTIDDLNALVIPLPAPVWMGLAGLGGVVCLRRRRLAAA